MVREVQTMNDKIKLPGGQLVSVEYVERLSRIVIAFANGIILLLGEKQSLSGKLGELNRVIEKTLEEKEPTGLHKEVSEYFDNKKIEDDFRLLEKENLVDVVRELTVSIKEIAQPTGTFDNELDGFIREMEQTDDLKDIRALKKKILEKTRSVKQGFAAVQTQLMKSQRLSEELNKRLKESEARVIIDALTKVLNRAAYDMKISQMVNHFNRLKEPACLGVIDIDNFKSINDKFGHDAGDNALISIANIIRTSIRENDVVFRYGGEEFAVIFNKAKIKDAQAVAERFRARIDNVRTHLVNDVYADKEKRVQITVSVGLAEIKEGDNELSLFKRADGALLRAKSNGKNQVLLS